LTDQLIMEAKRQNLEVFYFSRPLKSKHSREFISILLFWRWMHSRRRVITDSVKSEIGVMIIPMASPWDIFLGKRLMKAGIKVTRIIHDAKPHPGDTFPPKFWIKALCFDSSCVVTLSQYVSGQLTLLRYAPSAKIRVGELPYPRVRPISAVNSTSPRRNFLFIGRGRTYKGLDLLLASWPLVGDSDSILTIAGEGHVVSRDISRIQHLDRWLSDSEVLSLITNSDVVVLPYLEASQSGIIPVALSSNRPIVITPVGGLIEQIEDGINGVVSKGITPQALAAALNKATTQEFFFKSEVEFLQSSSELLKLCRR